MADVLTPEQRRRNMAAIKGKDTGPEMMVRRLVHSMGFRYGLHCRDLPGKPDLVFRRRKKIIFVHGCFWHSHTCKLGRPKPDTNAEFWELKRRGNAERDIRNKEKLEKSGWRVLTVWGCETPDRNTLAVKLADFLKS